MKFSIFALLFFIEFVALAQEGVTYQIRTLAKGSGKVLRKVEVRFGESITFSDPKGEVSLKADPSQGTQILFTRFGYEKLLVDLKDLDASKVNEVFIFPAPPSDNEVLVRGEKRPETSKKSFNIQEARLAAPGDDPAKIAQVLPGVQTAAFGSDIAVRGSAPEDSKYFIDNFEAVSIFRAIGDLSIIPKELIGDVDFYAGGFGPQYGNATGGVLTLRTKSEIPEEARTTFTLNIPFYSGVYHERPLSDGQSMVAVGGRYSYLQYILPAFLPKDSGATVTPSFSDEQVFYLKKYDDGGYLKILALGSQEGIQVVFPADQSTDQSGTSAIDYNRQFATLGLELNRPLGEGWTHTFSPQLLFDQSRINALSDKINWDFYKARVFNEWSLRRSKRENFYFGAEASYGEFQSYFRVPVFSDDPLFDYEDAERISKRKTYIDAPAAAWSSLDFEIAEDTIVTPGLRVYYDGGLGETSADPRFAARYFLTESQILKSSIGQYSKPPEPWQSSKDFGNPDIGFERSYHYVLGLESKWSDRFESEIQLYYKKLFNLAVSDPTENFVDDGEGRAWGAELFFRRNLTEKFFGWLSYTFSKTEYRDRPTENWYSSDFDQTHVAVLVASYKMTATWQVGSRLKYHTGDTYTPVSDSVYKSGLDKYSPRARDENRNTSRLPNYHRIDLNSTNDFLYDRWKLALRYGVDYLSASRQVYQRDYNYDYSDSYDTYLPQFIPFIELSGEF